MILNLKNDTSRRSVLFENLAKLLVRKERNNNFIFVTRNFTDIDEVIQKYRLNLSEIEHNTKELTANRFSSIDLIEFILDDYTNRIVKEIILYEVKSKNSTNPSRYDICLSSYETYKEAQSLGIKTKLLSFVLFEEWRYSFNIHDLDLSKYSVYSRHLNNRLEAQKKAKEIAESIE